MYVDIYLTIYITYHNTIISKKDLQISAKNHQKSTFPDVQI